MNEKIKRLQEEIESEQRRILNCKHNFDKAFYNAETIKQGYGSVQDGAGSDPHWGYVGYRDVKKDRWTRECKLCGFEQHTYSQKPIISGYEPSF